MPIFERVVEQIVKNNVDVYVCDDCGKETPPVSHSRSDVNLDGWVEVHPLGYGCDRKYYKYFCWDCVQKRGLAVGTKHEKWHE